MALHVGTEHSARLTIRNSASVVWLYADGYLIESPRQLPCPFLIKSRLHTVKNVPHSNNDTRYCGTLACLRSPITVDVAATGQKSTSSFSSSTEGWWDSDDTNDCLLRAIRSYWDVSCALMVFRAYRDPHCEVLVQVRSQMWGPQKFTAPEKKTHASV